jgi:hypothetical protein
MIMYTCAVVPIALVITNPDVKFDYYPLGLYIITVVYRAFIISIRHGTTPPRIYADMYEKPITRENLKEALLVEAWIVVAEADLSNEIGKALLKNDVYQDYFNFKVILPIYPPMRERFLNEAYYAENDWN